MLEEKINKIKIYNQTLCDYCDILYVDFYSMDNFIKLFEMEIENSNLSSLTEILTSFSYHNFWNRLTYIDEVINFLNVYRETELGKKVIKTIQRTFTN